MLCDVVVATGYCMGCGELCGPPSFAMKDSSFDPTISDSTSSLRYLLRFIVLSSYRRSEFIISSRSEMEHIMRLEIGGLVR